MREYLVDVFHYIDCLFSFIFFISIFQWLFGYDFDAVIFFGSFAGVMLWPNKKYWAKWLCVNNEG